MIGSIQLRSDEQNSYRLKGSYFVGLRAARAVKIVLVCNVLLGSGNGEEHSSTGVEHRSPDREGYQRLRSTFDTLKSHLKLLPFQI